MIRSVIAAAVVLVVTTPLTAAATEPVRASLSSEELLVTGATRGGQLVVVGSSSRTELSMLVRRRAAQVLTDSDNDGALTYRPDKGVPFRSIWVVIDIGSGSWAMASPSGYEVDHSSIDRKSLRKEADGLAVALELERLQAEVVLVRPGAGAWILRANEGGEGDADGRGGDKLTVVFDQALPLGDFKGKAPATLKAGDVLVLIDHGRMELRTLTVEK